MSRNLLFALVGVLASAACATVSPGAKYEITVKDDPVNQRYNLTLTNLRNRDLCFGSRDWPTRIGNKAIGYRGRSSYSENGVFVRPPPAIEEVCPECQLKLASKSQATGFIGYRYLGDVDLSLPTEQRKLELDIKPIRCDPHPRHVEFIAEQNLTHTMQDLLPDD